MQRSPITKAALVALLALALAQPTAAREATRNSRKYEIHVGRQPLTPALQALSRATGIQYGYLPTDEAEESVLVGPLDGSFTIEEALREVLPLGFRYEWINSRTISVIAPMPDEAPVLEQKHEREKGADRLFQDELSNAHRIEKVLDRVLVIDSRMSDFALEVPAATFVLDRPSIESLGVSTVTDAVAYISQLPYTRPEFGISGDQRAELRGLGRDTTPVLINGRRAGGSSSSIDINAFDLNTMPLAAVERIEVYLDEVPFDVGADAIGGVINLVIRTDTLPPRVDVHYGVAEGGAAERRASISAGEARDRWTFSAVLDYFARDELVGAERERWRNQDYRRFGGSDWRSTAGNPGNVMSLSSNLLPGLPSTIAAVPSHVAGSELTTSDFLPTAGQQNMDSLRRFRSIVPERERTSAVLSGEWNATPDMRAFGEFFYTEGDTFVRELPATLSNFPVPAANPWNPFGVPVAVSFRPSVGPRLWTTEAESLRALAGADGALGAWRWRAEVLHTRDSTFRVLENELDFARVAAALAGSDRSRAFNPFDDGPGGTAALISQLVATPRAIDGSTKDTEWRAQLSGVVARLPAGQISADIGAAHRESEITSTLSILPGSSRRSIDSAFLEIGVPIVNAHQSIPAISGLKLTAAARLDEYSDLGRQLHSQWVLSWRPVPQLDFRGTYATVYRPPSLYELNQNVVTIPVSAPDLRRRNEIANFSVTAGGNSQLRPTSARNWSLGLLWRPSGPRRLHASATYWHSDAEDRINPIILPVLLSNEELFPGRVTRALPTEADLAANLPGTLRAIDITLGNLGRLEASGLDLSLSLDTKNRFGRFHPTISLTWMDEFAVVDLPGADTIERVGIASASGTIPKWRGSVALRWSTGAIQATSVLRYVSAYDDFDVLSNRTTGRSVAAQSLLDLQAEWTIAEGNTTGSVWRGMSLTCGATNVLDRKPSFAEVGLDTGYDFTQGDLKGRFSYVRLSKRF